MPRAHLVFLAAWAAVASSGRPMSQDRADPGRHAHGAPHPETFDAKRFLTSRRSDIQLPLPEEEDAFFFAIFGDRTGGPPDGVRVLAKAVDEVNLLEPDLVMTVGDLVQGYNQTAEWLVQMREFKGIMNRLLMPWFPVAGNHDIYWGGPNKPPGEHEQDYEAHFGPLWYAFEHKNCWFVALFSDEGDPVTGEKGTGKPASQRMSPEQFEWLGATLKKAAGADHVFVFLHHPRWLGRGYGDDWNRVHALLAEAGNVTAVFAGHIHRMRYDGERDGIEYFTLATVGGAQAGDIPQAGYLHQYNLVTVRKGRIAVASVPVGAVFDPRAITGQVSEETRLVTRTLSAEFTRSIAFADDLGADDRVEVRVHNPASRPLELTLIGESLDPRWVFSPEHAHATVAPGAWTRLVLRAQRPADGVDAAFRLPMLTVHTDYLAEHVRVSLPERSFPIPVRTPVLGAPRRPAGERALVLDGDDHAVVGRALALPAGPFTLEAWVQPGRFRDRQDVLGRSASGGFGIMLRRDVPSFLADVGGRALEVAGHRHRLEADRWHHLAGVFDGHEMRLYVDGEIAARRDATDSRSAGEAPLVIGAQLQPNGTATAGFQGAIDEVRLSRGIRYAGESFSPRRRHEADETTLLLLHMDGPVGPWLFDDSRSANHAARYGARVESR